jgi:hypothetical protein
MVSICSTYGIEYNCIQIIIEKPEGKRQLGKPRRRRANNIKFYLIEIQTRRCGLI